MIMTAARESVRLTGVAVGAASLVVGAAIGTGYVRDVVAERDQLRAQVQAGPTAARTPSAPGTTAPRPSPTQVSRSSPEPAATRTVQPVNVHPASADRGARGGSSAGRGTDGRGTGGGGGGPAPPAVPSTPPSAPPAAECSDGQLISVTLPLQLLPCNAIQIGGTP